MKKLFISADIEGTCGIAHWNETEKNHADWAYFAGQMTKEVAAACEGAKEGGMDEVLVKDAHDSARNIDPGKLPVYAQVLRGWGGNPSSMMFGLDDSYHGVVMTGYHSPAGFNGNPLAHTMTTQLAQLTINGEIASELMLNSLTAASLGVPVYAVSGDKQLCEWMKSKSPNTATIPVNEGSGGAVRSVHPTEAVRMIREAVADAVQKPREDFLFPMPEHFEVVIRHKDHQKTTRSSYYPGMQQVDAHTLKFEHDDWYEVLRMMHFCL